MRFPRSPIPRRRGQFGELLELAVPIVLVQVGMMAMGVVDSIMVGHVSPAALAGVALGNVYWFSIAIFGQGVLLALDPVVSQAVGARDEPAISRALRRGLLLAVALTLPVSVLLLPTGPVLGALGQPADVTPVAAGYVLREIPGVYPFFAFVVFRQTLQALGRLRPVLWAILAANLTNVALNWVLIFGRLGAPAMGANGSAWSTTVSRWLMLGLIVALGWRALGHRLRAGGPRDATLRPLLQMLAIGAPIGVHMQLEFGVFGVVGLLMGRVGTTAVAAHQVALNLASLTFMVPLGVSAAATVLVGRAVGRHDPSAARQAAAAATVVGVGFMALSAIGYLAAPGFLARLYSTDPGVVALAATLIPIAGVFQVFDGLQVVSSGVLRGLADTRYPMVVGLVGFWVVGLPAGLWLAFGRGLGAAGLWWGLVAGLTAVALLLAARVRRRLRGGFVRVVIDEA